MKNLPENARVPRSICPVIKVSVFLIWCALCAPWTAITCLFSFSDALNSRGLLLEMSFSKRKGPGRRSRGAGGHLATEKECTMGREAAVPPPAPRESLGKVNEHSERERKHHKWQGKEESIQGTKEKLQINASGWGEEEPVWPKESKQVTGPTPGTEGVYPWKAG